MHYFAAVQALQGTAYHMPEQCCSGEAPEEQEQETTADSPRVSAVETTGVHSRSASVRVVEFFHCSVLLGLDICMHSSFCSQSVQLRIVYGHSSIVTLLSVACLPLCRKYMPSSCPDASPSRAKLRAPSRCKFRLLIVGDGGWEVAGENTPTPDNLRLLSSEVKYACGWTTSTGESGENSRSMSANKEEESDWGV